MAESYHTEDEHAQSDKLDIVVRELGRINCPSHIDGKKVIQEGLFAARVEKSSLVWVKDIGR